MLYSNKTRYVQVDKPDISLEEREFILMNHDGWIFVLI